MDFESAERYLQSLISHEKNLGAVVYQEKDFNLQRVRKALAGIDYDGLKYIHVAGSKGKGSTCVMMADYLKRAGYKVGLFTSPHMFSVRERIVLNSQIISEEDFVRLVEQIQGLDLTYFEALTVMGLIFFVQQEVDYVILEVGLGGRLDSTNVIKKPELAIITTVELEHQGILGDTVSEILTEKLGIVKDSHPVLIGWQSDEVDGLVSQKLAGRQEVYMIGDFEDLDLEHFDQARVKNAKVVYAGLSLLLPAVDDVLFQQMFDQFTLLGRFDQREIDGHQVIFDMAHTINSMDNLLNGLKLMGVEKPLFLLGFLKDKDVEGMLSLIKSYGGEIVFTECHLERGFTGKGFWQDPDEAFEYCLKQLKREQSLVVTGSHFLIAKVLPRQ